MGFSTFAVYTYNIGTSTAYEGSRARFYKLPPRLGRHARPLPARAGRAHSCRRRDYGRAKESSWQLSSCAACAAPSGRSSPSTTSTSTCARASSSPCSGRAAAARRRRCGSVAGFDWPDSGEVLVDGEDVLAKPANKRNMGMVFQAYSLFPNMTAQQNVEFGLRVRKQSRERHGPSAPGSCSSSSGSPAPWPATPASSPGGQQQRVALAQFARHPAECSSARRASLGPRRQGPRAASRGGAAHPARARHHDPLCDPRPGRGAFDLGSGGGHVRRAGSSSSGPRRRSTAVRGRPSWRTSSGR